jgi:hypothetical protein
MTDESNLDFGFGLTLWVSEMIQDEKQQFSSGVLFLQSESPLSYSRFGNIGNNPK